MYPSLSVEEIPMDSKYWYEQLGREVRLFLFTRH